MADQDKEGAAPAEPQRQRQDQGAFGAHVTPQIEEGPAAKPPDQQIAQKPQQSSGQGSGQS